MRNVSTTSTWILLLVAVCALLATLVNHNGHDIPRSSSHDSLTSRQLEQRHEDDEAPTTVDHESTTESEIFQQLTEKLTTPRKFAFVEEAQAQDAAAMGKQRLATHQFLHLHHMKTGGTSMDHYLRCAMDRMTGNLKYDIPYASIHECSRTRYEKCRSGEDAKCQTTISNASIMSYCAPLKDLHYFDWTEPPAHGAITVLRNPVDRVWSMFRFKTKNCFKCMPLIEIYDLMDSGDLSALEPSCYQQLENHEVTNLLSTDWPTNTTEEFILTEAITNMKSFFTVIGITEQLDATIEIAGHVFPWMKPTVNWADRECSLSHSNASPKNNRCAQNGSHWDLPAHPDEETRAAIEAHNQLDLELYAAAVEHFELQKRAIGSGEDAE